MEDELFSIGDAAQYANRSPSAVRLWVAAGKLPAIRTRGGIHLVRKSDLDNLIASMATRRRGFSAGGRLLQLSNQR